MDCEIEVVMKARRFFSGLFMQYGLFALLLGAVLFLFGFWCLDSNNIPTPSLSLPFPPRFLGGISFLLVQPIGLIPLTLGLTISRYLCSKMGPLSAIAVAIVSIGAVLIAAYWVPNPFILWPFSVLGEHTLQELIGEVFTFHIIPTPEISYSSPASFNLLIRWQAFESGTRFLILLAGWSGCLFTVWKFDRGRHRHDALGQKA